MRHQILDLKDLQIVAFDWDNTLALSREVLVCAINKVLPKYGLGPWSELQVHRDVNLSFRDNFPLIFGDDFERAYDEYVAVYKSIAPQMLRKPEKVDELLNFFKQNNICLVIVTNKDRNLLEFEMPLLYDISLFDNIVCGHEAEADKPHAEQLEYAVKNKVAKITAKTVWMVGDSEMDSRCALAAGALAIRIGTPIWGDIEEENLNQVFFDNFADFYSKLVN